MSWEKAERILLRLFSMVFWAVCAVAAYALLWRVAMVPAALLGVAFLAIGAYALFGRSRFSKFARWPGYLVALALQALQ